MEERERGDFALREEGKDLSHHRPRKRIRTAGTVFCLLALAFLMIWLKAFYGSMAAYDRGESLLEVKDYARAVTFFDRSIHWYTPFNPYVEKSAERLWEMSGQAEKRGDIRLSLMALRAVRRGFYAARGLYAPGKGWIERAEGEIRRLTAGSRNRAESSGMSGGEAAYSPEGGKDGNPDVAWTVVLEIGLLGWIGSMVGFILSLFQDKERGKFILAPAFTWGGLALIFFSMWVFGMMKA
jgi:hypothetical protein